VFPSMRSLLCLVLACYTSDGPANTSILAHMFGKRNQPHNTHRSVHSSALSSPTRTDERKMGWLVPSSYLQSVLRPAATLSLISGLAKIECAYWPHIRRPASTIDLTAQGNGLYPTQIRTVGVFLFLTRVDAFGESSLSFVVRTRKTDLDPPAQFGFRGNNIAKPLCAHLVLTLDR
jgi:hypothetical protein